MKKHVLILLFILIGIAVFLFYKDTPSAQAPEYNVLWLTGESTRPDHLGVYGYSRNTSPHIDRFARTGVIFTQAFNPSGWTSENMVSNLTGINSMIHGVDVRNKSTPSEWYMPLEMLKDFGYKTARIQAFQKIPNYDFIGLDNDDSPDDVIAWLKKNKDERFFIWYHLLESHLPYNAPDEHKNLFWDDRLVKNETSKKRLDQVLTSSLVVRGEATFKDEDREAIIALYDGGIHYMDSSFGKIIRAVDQLGLRDNTLIIFSADHGDELLDHGFVGHASTAKGGHLHDEIIHVPLILSLPQKLPEDFRINKQVRGLDIMPTIFDLLGLTPPSYFEGESLLPIMKNPEKEKDRVAFASSSYQGYQADDPEHIDDYMRSVRTPDWKLFYHIWDMTREEFYLYHLTNDPKEQINVADEFPQKTNELTELMRAWEKKSKSLQIPKEPDRESLVIKLTRWVEELFTGKETLALIAKAPSPPQIIAPRENEVIRFQDIQGKLRLEWEGLKGVPYLVDISAGSGKNHIDVQFKTNETWLERDITESYWKEYILLYQPVKIRVKINRTDHAFGPWRSFKME